MIHRRKGPKKQLKWKPQEELEDVRYFELDETERVNVTKTFIEQKQMERFDERKALVLGRKYNNEDSMTEQVPWRPLIEVDNVPVYEYGSKSHEKKIQSDREKTVLQSLFFTGIPDSPTEADQGTYDYAEPIVIPTEDLSGNPDGVNDFSNLPWPESKPDATVLLNTFPTVFPAPTMFPTAPPAVAPFQHVNPAIWNINPMVNVNVNGLTGIPRMPDLGMMGNPTGIPSLLTDVQVPFATPPPFPPRIQNQVVNQMNNRNPIRDRERDRGDRNYNRDRDWRDRSRGGARNWIHNNHRNVCRQYEQKGFCRNGDNCNYYHPRN